MAVAGPSYSRPADTATATQGHDTPDALGAKTHGKRTGTSSTHQQWFGGMSSRPTRIACPPGHPGHILLLQGPVRRRQACATRRHRRRADRRRAAVGSWGGARDHLALAPQLVISQGGFGFGGILCVSRGESTSCCCASVSCCCALSRTSSI
jgi:microcystin-dependent protein